MAETYDGKSPGVVSKGLSILCLVTLFVAGIYALVATFVVHDRLEQWGTLSLVLSVISLGVVIGTALHWPIPGVVSRTVRKPAPGMFWVVFMLGWGAVGLFFAYNRSHKLGLATVTTQVLAAWVPAGTVAIAGAASASVRAVESSPTAQPDEPEGDGRDTQGRAPQEGQAPPTDGLVA